MFGEKSVLLLKYILGSISFITPIYLEIRVFSVVARNHGAILSPGIIDALSRLHKIFGPCDCKISATLYILHV